MGNSYSLWGTSPQSSSTVCTYDAEISNSSLRAFLVAGQKFEKKLGPNPIVSFNDFPSKICPELKQQYRAFYEDSAFSLLGPKIGKKLGSFTKEMTPSVQPGIGVSEGIKMIFKFDPGSKYFNIHLNDAGGGVSFRMKILEVETTLGIHFVAPSN